MKDTMYKPGSFPQLRLRRNRKYEWSRRMLSEHRVTKNDLIWPLFVRDKESLPSSRSMPGVKRITIEEIPRSIYFALKSQIPAVALFPVVLGSKKDDQAQEAVNIDNLMCKAIKLIKVIAPNIGIIADVALDPYTCHGHDGIINEGEVDNDLTITMLCKQSLVLAKSGADIIAPSDMMDGRVKRIRETLDKENFKDVAIMSYAAKYASSFYGPFRDLIGSKKNININKLSYQMSPCNAEEARREIMLDIEEGADSIIIKPGIPYLDILNTIKKNFPIPIFTYQVSGEYAMLKAAGMKNWVNYDDIIMECMISFKRAGANGVWTYAAPEVCKILKKNNTS